MKKILKTAKYVTVASVWIMNRTWRRSHGYDEQKNCIYFHCATEGKKSPFFRRMIECWDKPSSIMDMFRALAITCMPRHSLRKK